MRRLRDYFVDGLLLAVPLIVLGYILVVAVQFFVKLSAPLARHLPDIRWFGIAAVDVVAVLILVLVLVLLGIFARSPLGHRFSKRLERVVLSKIPGFLFFKSMAAAVTGENSADAPRPALVRFDDNTVLGFIIEAATNDSDLVTVFVPSAPTPVAGNVFLMPRDRVQQLDIPVATAMATVTRLGIGLKQLLAADDSRNAGSKSA